MAANDDRWTECSCAHILLSSVYQVLDESVGIRESSKQVDKEMRQIETESVLLPAAAAACSSCDGSVV